MLAKAQEVSLSDPQHDGTKKEPIIEGNLPTIIETAEAWHTDNWSILNETLSPRGSLNIYATDDEKPHLCATIGSNGFETYNS